MGTWVNIAQVMAWCLTYALDMSRSNKTLYWTESERKKTEDFVQCSDYELTKVTLTNELNRYARRRFFGWYLDLSESQCVSLSLQWGHNERDGVSNHQPQDCLPNRLFMPKKTSKLRVTRLCAGIHWWPTNSPHKRPVTRKMFPFDYVIRWPVPCIQWTVMFCYSCRSNAGHAYLL